MLYVKNALIILALLGMVFWFFAQKQPVKKTHQQQKPQEYMSQLVIINYNEAGTPKEQMSADYWEFIPDNKRSDLTNPHVKIYKQNGDIWFLSAQKALAWHPTIGEKITQLDLSGDVTIERPAENNAVPTKINTLALQYFPEEKKVTSLEFVSMQQPGIEISGVGLLGFLDQNWIELHDKITTVYTPNIN